MKNVAPTQTPLPLLVDLKGLSARVSLSVSTLRKYINDGMPHIKPGRKILVDPEEAVDWLKQATEAAACGQDDDDLSALLDEVLNRLE